MSKIVGASKITARYQVTIPLDARKILEASIGDILVFIEEDRRIYVTTKI